MGRAPSEARRHEVAGDRPGRSTYRPNCRICPAKLVIVARSFFHSALWRAFTSWCSASRPSTSLIAFASFFGASSRSTESADVDLILRPGLDATRAKYHGYRDGTVDAVRAHLDAFDIRDFDTSLRYLGMEQRPVLRAEAVRHSTLPFPAGRAPSRILSTNVAARRDMSRTFAMLSAGSGAGPCRDGRADEGEGQPADWATVGVT